ncbi:MAG TPA: DUF6526 family protein [Candidatus Sulfotelmatobacter sp.]|nr:DUF6526 family protein [Candidatus Sulfotelmatobacter sp.]
MSEQNFKNHVRFVPLYHFFALPMLVVNFGWSIYRWIAAGFSISGLEWVLTSAALFFGVVYPRLFALNVQDRVIRLEERLRYEQVLPEELRWRADELTVDQLVSLRFASDEELEKLMRKVLDGKLTERKAIKRLIKNWRPDSLRA